MYSGDFKCSARFQLILGIRNVGYIISDFTSCPYVKHFIDFDTKRGICSAVAVLNL